jgi:hypothetical protein
MVIAAIAPAALSAIVVNPLGRTIAMSRIPQLKFIADAVRLVAPLWAIYLCGVHAISFIGAAASFAVATVIGDMCYFAIVMYAVAPQRLRERIA